MWQRPQPATKIVIMVGVLVEWDTDEGLEDEVGLDEGWEVLCGQ